MSSQEIATSVHMTVSNNSGKRWVCALVPKHFLFLRGVELGRSGAKEEVGVG